VATPVDEREAVCGPLLASQVSIPANEISADSVGRWATGRAGPVCGLSIGANCSSIGWSTSAYEKRCIRAAQEQGWLQYYKRGGAILKKLSSLGPEDQKKLSSGAYRGERVAFVGGGAPPGGTNDLITGEGFYLRIVNKEGKDLRPHAVWWEILVCG